MNIIKKIYFKLKNDIVLTVSLILAIISIFIVKVEPIKYITEYINYSVIVLLFCFMVSVAGLRQSKVFNYLSKIILKKTKNTQLTSLLIIIITFFASMFITNDVALITFVPISIILFKEAKNQSQLIKVITFQTIGANIGSTLTPFGNPQNLYLYSYYNLNFLEFIKITCMPTLLGLIILIISNKLIKKKNINIKQNYIYFSKKKTIFYIILFFISLLPIFHICHYLISLSIIGLLILIFDRKILKKVDYGLLLTFICFFIFINNIQNIENLSNYIKTYLNNKTYLYWISCFLSQIISNVPCAIFLSKFTEDFKTLILGVNVGGLGTLIASLANVISYNFFKNFKPRLTKKYLSYFLLINSIYFIIISLIIYILI